MIEPYKLSDGALADLGHIWDYIGADDPLAADNFIQQLLRTCALLASSPRMGRARGDLGKGLRSHPVGDYLIFYQILTEAIEIVRIVHGGQDLHALFASFPQ